MENIRRGEIYYADLSPVIGSEPGRRSSGSRPAERCREPIQLHYHRGGDHIHTKEDQTAYSHYP